MKKLKTEEYPLPLEGILFGLACVVFIVFMAAMAIKNERLQRRVNSLEESITATTTTETTTTEMTTTEETTTTTTTTTAPLDVRPLLVQDMSRRLDILKALIKDTRQKAEVLLDKQKKGEQLTADEEIYLRFYSSAVMEETEIELYLKNHSKEDE